MDTPLNQDPPRTIPLRTPFKIKTHQYTCTGTGLTGDAGFAATAGGFAATAGGAGFTFAATSGLAAIAGAAGFAATDGLTATTGEVAVLMAGAELMYHNRGVSRAVRCK